MGEDSFGEMKKQRIIQIHGCTLLIRDKAGLHASAR
jgi:hypothetical protein